MILVLTVSLKFDQGGWVTIAMTGGVVLVCLAIRHHYDKVNTAVSQLEVDILPDLYSAESRTPNTRDPSASTAILLTNGFNGLGLATFTALARLFGKQFHNVVFIGVGEVDSALLKSPEDVTELESRTAEDLTEYCRLASDFGFHAEQRSTIGTDVVLELRRLCLRAAHDFKNSVFLAGQMILGEENEGYLGRFLHSRTALELLKWLQARGLSLVILTVRVELPDARERGRERNLDSLGWPLKAREESEG